MVKKVGVHDFYVINAYESLKIGDGTSTPVVARLTNLQFGNSYPLEAISIDGQPYFTAQATYLDTQVLDPQGEVERPIVVYNSNDDLVNGNDNARNLNAFGTGLFWTALDSSGLQKLYGKYEGNLQVNDYCAINSGICDFGVASQIATVGNVLIAQLFSDVAGIRRPYYLTSSSQELLPVADSDGTNLMVRTPTFTQVGDHIYATTSDSFEGRGAQIWKYDLNMQNPEKMTQIGDLSLSTVNVTAMIPFKSELYFTTSRGTNVSAVFNELWKWDGVSDPVFLHAMPSGTNNSPGQYVTTENRIYFKYSLILRIGSTDGSQGGSYYDHDISRSNDLVAGADSAFVSQFSGIDDSVLYRIYDDSLESVEIAALQGLPTVQTPTLSPHYFRGALYYFDRELKRADSDNQITTVDIPNYVFDRTARILYSDDNTLLFRASDSVNRTELWQLQ